jgi:hypothetical protein
MVFWLSDCFDLLSCLQIGPVLGGFLAEGEAMQAISGPLIQLNMVH